MDKLSFFTSSIFQTLAYSSFIHLLFIFTVLAYGDNWISKGGFKMKISFFPRLFVCRAIALASIAAYVHSTPTLESLGRAT